MAFPFHRTTRSRARRSSFVPRLSVLEDRCLLSLTAADHGQLVYDSDAVDLRADGKPGAIGVYWLANANLAATQTFGVTGINPDGSMTWETALNWVAALNAFNNGKGYLGHNNWTLPLTPDHDPGHTATQTGPDPFDDDFGFDFYSSLFGHLFYTELGGHAGDSVSSLPLAQRLFKHFEPDYYWGGNLPISTRDTPPDFSFNIGYLATDVHIDFEYALPEFSVDASDQPVPPLPNYNYQLQQLPTNPSLTPNPDGRTVHDSDFPTTTVNWLANANLAATKTFGVQGINADGTMNYKTATDWIAATNAANYLGHNDWRLPGGDLSPTQDYYRTGDEMGELFYTELGGQAGSTIQLTHDAQYGLFSNLQPYHYWSSTANLDKNGSIDVNTHESFSFSNGLRSGNTDPNEMDVVPVFDGNVWTVTSTLDDGSMGSLRGAIAAAQPGDTIEFSPGLIGATIVLQSPIDITVPLYIVGPGAGRLTLSGNNTTGIFDIGPGASGTEITCLTFARGRSGEGGALLDDGASLLVQSCVFQNNSAVGAAGGAGLGGAVAILGESTTGMAVSLTNCRFDTDTATGGAAAGGSGTPPTGGAGDGGAVYMDAETSTGLSLVITASQFTNDSAAGGAGAKGDATSATLPTDGGNGEGGALFVWADAAARASFDFSSDTFAHNQATGGAGGNGDGASQGQDGARGGDGEGGAMAYLDGAAVRPNLTVEASTFTANAVVAGGGGAGGDGTGTASTGGKGGRGGLGAGGALVTLFQQSVGAAVVLTGDDFSSNSVVGGKGGTGGAGSFAGGVGGAGGEAHGGAAALTTTNNATTTSLLMTQARIRGNSAQGGAGAAGGKGLFLGVGGQGGDGGGALGGGFYLSSSGSGDPDTWTLDRATVQGNRATSAAGGRGGNGLHGGGGGDSEDSSGGGVDDAFQGTVNFLDDDLTANAVLDASGGASGLGAPAGARGQNSAGLGGGLNIDPGATALATSDMLLRHNKADNGAEWFGTLDPF